MQVICKDGTTIQCREFEATGSGVLFYQETQRSAGSDADEDEEEAELGRASGFIPHSELQFVLPDEMVRGREAQPAGAPQGAVGGGVQAPPPRGGDMAQQQQLQGIPGAEQHQPGPGTGRY